VPAHDSFQHQIDSLVARGGATIVGTVNADGSPRGVRGWSISIVDASNHRVRVAVAADDPVVVENLRRRPVAVTTADVMTFESVQLKGSASIVEPPTEADLADVSAQTAAFLEAIERVDRTPTELAMRFVSQTVVMIEMVVEQQFDQTPGPGAGARVRAG
jgi:hypothetical protein